MLLIVHGVENTNDLQINNIIVPTSITVVQPDKTIWTASTGETLGRYSQGPSLEQTRVRAPGHGDRGFRLMATSISSR
jgi:hypothetical protein